MLWSYYKVSVRSIVFWYDKFLESLKFWSIHNMLNLNYKVIKKLCLWWRLGISEVNEQQWCSNNSYITNLVWDIPLSVHFKMSIYLKIPCKSQCHFTTTFGNLEAENILKTFRKNIADHVLSIFVYNLKYCMSTNFTTLYFRATSLGLYK